MNRITAIHEAIGASRNESEAIYMKVTSCCNFAPRKSFTTFGAVGAWLINYSLGIRRDETSPGFKLSLHID